MEEIVSKSQIEINIHRGANQIGGCITEIATAQSRIIIDLGSNLPGSKGIDGRTNSRGCFWC